MTKDLQKESEKKSEEMMISDEIYMTSGVNIGKNCRYEGIYLQSSKWWTLYNRY